MEILFYIFILITAGGYMRLCFFGSYSLKEATFWIITTNVGILLALFIAKILEVEDYWYAIAVPSIIACIIIGKLFVKRITDKEDNIKS